MTRILPLVLCCCSFSGAEAFLSNSLLSFTETRSWALAAEESSNSEVVDSLVAWNATASSAADLSSASFGDVVPMQRPAAIEENEYLVAKPPFVAEDDSLMAIQESKKRNLRVAIASVLLAASSYFWQFTHPITPVQLLFTMQQSSQPISVIGVNEKPTVVDFWAPWCENCKLIAPTLRQVEEEYKDRVNFVMVDGDKAESWPYIEAFGVDAIPHLALVSAEGDVETALIGPVPKHVLEEDLEVLLSNAKNNPQQSHQSLPYRMLDVFAGNPAGRRVHFDQ